MASYRFDRAKGSARIIWRFGGKQLSKTIRCETEREAERACAAVEEAVQDVARGKLVLPPDADPRAFLFSGGRVSGAPVAVVVEALVPVLTVAGMIDVYRADLPPGLEPSTRKMVAVHLRRIVEFADGSAPLGAFGRASAQSYVTARGKATYRGRKIARQTIEKELSSLRGAWAWVAGRVEGVVPPAWSIRDLSFPKCRPVAPFRTWAEIEAEIARRGLKAREVVDLWDTLWLDRDQVRGVLKHVRESGGPPYLAPMIAAAAFTGARRSEVCRSRLGDWDLAGGKAKLRQKKRDKDREFSFRDVPVHRELAVILRAWFDVHPGGGMAFANPDGAEVTWPMAAHHFRAILAGSRWKVVPCWHCLRHSFASILASTGVDQRLIDSWMGHSTSIRLRYQHLRPEDQRDAIGLL